ncbi:ABC transporter substrate-binding protein [Streptomyces sp. NPDC059002]|uniref:ABC transporter substrate-binding protein n=1 Tax=Streptomyces sp. NPDC059002 TaxID=3346690 RepID=UPI0036A87E6D
MTTSLRAKILVASASLSVLAAATWLVADANEESHTHPKGVGIPRKIALPTDDAQLPERILERGVLRVGTDLSYAPMEFVRDGRAVGLDIDIAKALGRKLGIEVDFVDSGFATLVPAVDSGAIDLAVSSMTDTRKRQKKVDFVDYLAIGTSILTRRGNPHHLTSLDDLCGKTITLLPGTDAHDVADKTQKAKCESPIKVLPRTKEPYALALVHADRAAAYLTDLPAARYKARTSGDGKDFEVIGKQAETHPWGIAVHKDEPRLRDAVAGALDVIIANGEYGRILAKWGAEQGAVKHAVINGG